MRSRLGIMGVIIGLGLAGCSVMPVAGPQSWDITSGQSDLPYALVRVTPPVLDVLASNAPRIAGAFNDRRGPDTVLVGIGDIVGVTIFDTGSGLFLPSETSLRPSNYITVPPQAVGADGNITVPSAGTIAAAGHTIADIQRRVVAALKNRALEPNVVVTLLDQRASSYTLMGDVRGGGRFPLLWNGERLLDAVGRGGGLSGPGNESWVVLERHGKRAVAPFGALVDLPQNNVFVRPGDTIYIYREPQTFVAFGASGRQGQIPFDAWRVSLSEAIAKAAGLSDASANPAAVFIYRGESREVAQLLGADVSKFDGPLVPVIYQVNLRDPAGYFLTSKFEMRNKDVIYVSNAVSVEATKFMNYLNTIFNTVNEPINTGINVYSLKGLINGTATTTTAIVTGH